MKQLLGLSLLLASTAIHANCGDLEIKIINNSNQNCILKNKIMHFGTLPLETVPTQIHAGESTPIFTVSQDTIGIGVLLAYTCGNEIVKFTSWQHHCDIFGAGQTWGEPDASTTLNLDYVAEGGSIFGRSGKITWRIS